MYHYFPKMCIFIFDLTEAYMVDFTLQKLQDCKNTAKVLPQFALLHEHEIIRMHAGDKATNNVTLGENHLKES